MGFTKPIEQNFVKISRYIYCIQKDNIRDNIRGGIEMSEAKKMIGYARVSSIGQNEDRQIIALKERGVAEKNIYVDKYTGRSFERPQYMKMMKRVDEDTVLYIKSIDRLGRNYQELSDQWRIITKVKGADIVVIDMPILDTRREKSLLGTFISDLVMTLLSYCSANELNLIHQRQAEGIAAAKARGVKIGRPPKSLPENFSETYRKWKEGSITALQAAKICGMALSTFKYKAKGYHRKETGDQL